MIKCLDDGKGNLDSKFILRGSFLSVSNDRLCFSFVHQFLSCKLGFIERFSAKLSSQSKHCTCHLVKRSTGKM